MKWTDGEIDKLFQERTENLSFEYKNDYWKEFSDSMPYVVSGESDFDMADSEIDKLYQTKAKNLSFNYQSSYWKEMAAMLPQRKKRDAVWYITSFVFIGLLVMTPFVSQNEVELNNLTAQEENATALQGEGTNSNEAVVDANNQKGEENSSVNSEVNSNLLSEDVAPTNHISNNSESSKPTHDLVETNGLNPNDDLNNNPSNNVVHHGNSSLTNNVLGENTIGEGIENPEPFTDPLIVSNSDDDAVTPQNINETSVDIGDLAVKPLDRNEINNEIIDLNGNIPAKELPTVTNFYIEMNGGISQSLISPSEKISYAFGIGIGTQIQKGRFNFTTGLNGLLSNHQDLELSRQAKVYGFGSETFSYQLQYKQIYSLEAVLSVGYRMGPHTLSLGVRPSFVVGSKVTYDSGTTEGTERQVVYGYMEGIKRFGIKPMIGYSVNLSPNLMLGVNVGMKLTPSVNEDFINGVNNSLPIDGQIYLRKSLSFRR